MKRKLLFTIIGLFIFVSCFAISLIGRDYYCEQQLRNKAHKVKIGMTEKEVIEILGQPSQEQMSDDGFYWCYDTSSIGLLFDDCPDRLGTMILKMSSNGGNGKVVKVFDFEALALSAQIYE